MRVVLLGMVAALALPAAASAQWPPPPKPAQPSYGYGYGSYGQMPQPAPRTTFDYSSGNMYTTTPSYDGGATVRGSNLNTGSMWTTRIQPNGDMTGTDSDGNIWQYNRSTGSYMSSDGTVCMGTGALRQCF